MSDIITRTLLSPIPLKGFPWQHRPYNNITPFTVRDGITYIDELEAIKRWLRDTLVTHLDTELGELGEDYQAATNALAEAIAKFNADSESYAAELTEIERLARVAQAAAAASAAKAEQWNASTQTLQDNAATALVRDELSALRGALDTQYDVVFPAPRDAFGQMVNCAPAIQALIDKGVKSIRSVKGHRYLIDGPIFIDGYDGVGAYGTDPRLSFALDGDGAVWFFGPNAGAQSATYGSATVPDVPAWNGIPYKAERSTRHVFWMNTKRGALNKSTNIVADPVNNCATGKNTATVGIGLRLTNMDVRYHEYVDRTISVRVMLLNNTTGVFTGRTSFINGVAATVNYCDSNNFSDTRLTNPSGYRPSILKQEGNGDNLRMSYNTDARALGADLRNCHGAHITGVGGGVRIVECTGVKLDELHIEADEPLRVDPAIYWVRSSGDVSSNVLWAGVGGRKTIVVADGTGNNDVPTMLNITNHVSKAVVRPEAIADEQQMPDIEIDSLNDNSRIRCTNSYGYMQPDVTSAAIWRTGLWVTSSNADIQAALDAGAGLIAMGNWELRRHNGWRVVALDRPNIREVTSVTVAPLWSGSSVWDAIKGVLLSGTYSYYMASIDEDNVHGPLSVARDVTIASATGTSTRLIIATTKPGRVAIWRGPKPGSGQTFVPDAYAIVGVAGVRTFIHDTGNNVNRRPWSKASIPAMPATSVPGNSVTKYIIDGKTVL